MRIYSNHDMLDALAHANREAGQALWLDSQLGAGHLFDQDTERLRKTLVALGVREVVIGQVGTPRQSALVQGQALKRAIAVNADASQANFGEVREMLEGVGDA